MHNLPQFNVHPIGVVHIGAHHGQEIDEYYSWGVKKVVCFEPLQDNFNVLQQRASTTTHVFRCALGEREDTVMMHLSSNGLVSSSVLTPKLHLIKYPDVQFNGTESVTMHKLVYFREAIADCDLLVIDVQGYEYQVLLGAEDLLRCFKYIYAEINSDETYQNNVRVSEIDKLLSQYSLGRIVTWWREPPIDGDALYVRHIDV